MTTRSSGGAGLPGNAGLPWSKVRVLSVEGGKAICLDQFGSTRTLPIGNRRGNGPKPRVGEEWAIDRTLGFWSFASVLTAKPALVSGSVAGVPALAALLEELESSGLITVDRNESGSLVENSASTWASTWTTLSGTAAQYRKIVGGLVLLRGTLIKTDTGTLPVECRPSVTVNLHGLAVGQKIQATQAGDSAGNAQAAIVFTPLDVWGVYPVTVTPAGLVTVGGTVSVDQCSFLAEP